MDTLTLEFTPADTAGRMLLGKKLGQVKFYADAIDIIEHCDNVEFYEFKDESDYDKVTGHFNRDYEQRLFIKLEDVNYAYMERCSYPAKHEGKREMVKHYALKISFGIMNEQYNVFIKNREECLKIYDTLNDWKINEGDI